MPVCGPGRLAETHTEGPGLVDQDGAGWNPVTADERGGPVDRRAGVDGSELERLVHPRSAHADTCHVHEQGIRPDMQSRRSLRVVDRLQRRSGVTGAQLPVLEPDRHIAVQPTRGAHERTSVAVR